MLDKFEKQLLPIANVSIVTDWEDLFSKLLLGEAIIFLDGVNQGLAASTRGGEQRSILQPESEVTLRGPRDSFTESISTNTSLVRRRINNPNLWLESMKIGKVSQTDVGIMYINGIANEKIVKVKERLKRIDIDQINDSGEIEQFIEDDPYSVFPTTVHTERPDVVAANLMEGKVAIFVNGSPYAITVPTLFIEFFHAADDYYSRFDIALALRFLRIAIFFIALITPSAYVAITTYHQEMIPTILIIAIAAQREAVPFPAFFEALLMEVTFEILREAGVRLPRPVGSAVSIVGALVIGQAAIQAKLFHRRWLLLSQLLPLPTLHCPLFPSLFPHD